MASCSTLFLVNPNANNGNDQKLWKEELSPLAAQEIGAFQEVMEQSPEEAFEEVDKWIGEKPRLIAVGGDGSLNGIVNHLFKKGKKCALGCIPLGTGNDLCRSLAIPNSPKEALRIIRLDCRKEIDIGKISAVDKTNQIATHYFINIASIGLTAKVVNSVNLAPETKLDSHCYKKAFIKAALSHNAQNFTISEEGGETYNEVAAKIITLCNGQYFGKGNKVSSGSNPSDGKMELHVFKYPIPEFPSLSLNTLPVTIGAEDPDHPFPIEADGEYLGEFIEATFSLAGKIEMIVPPFAQINRRTLKRSE